jgi:hypothetical protein
MSLKPSMKKVSSVASAAILGMAISGVASATDFNVNATVQNALTVTKVADMNLGTLFATTASNTAYKYITLAPAGTMNTAAGAATIILLGLGGQSAADASVAVGNTTPFTVTLPSHTAAVEATGAVGGVITALQGLASPVEVALADPSVARFTLIDFRAGAPTGGTAAAGCATTATCVLTPSFGSTSVGFKIGATIVTDVSGTRTAYQAGSYTGTFAVTASY